MKERARFMLDWERRWKAAKGGWVNMSELCRVYGVSRQTGYQWLERYRDAGHDLRALDDRSRRPHHSPTAVDEEMQSLVVEARKQHPTWGPRKLRAWLSDRRPDVAFPSPSCVGSILRRAGLTHPRKRGRRRATPSTRPFADCAAPNDVWCVDFKGKFRTLDGRWCHALTVTDAYSRYLVRCEVVADPNGYEVERVFDSAFQEFGLPAAIRSDNGPPFASTGAGGLTRLAVWWFKLGIRLERIEPGKPYQNGRHERMHLSLEEVTASPRRNQRAQQRAFDLWRKEYNEDRPHEALNQRPPAKAYVHSSRRYPRPLTSPQVAFEGCWVDKDGSIRWRRHKVFISTALFRETIQLEPTYADGLWEVSYGSMVLGKLDEANLHRGLIRPRRRARTKNREAES